MKIYSAPFSEINTNSLQRDVVSSRRAGQDENLMRHFQNAFLTPIELFNQAINARDSQDYIARLRRQVKWVDLREDDISKMYQQSPLLFLECFDRFDSLYGRTQNADQQLWQIALKLGMFNSLVGGFLLLLGDTQDIHLILPLFLSIIDAWQAKSYSCHDHLIETVLKAVLKKSPYFLISALQIEGPQRSERIKFFAKYSQNLNAPMFDGFEMTPLEYAVKKGDWILFEELCKAGADPLRITLSIFNEEELRGFYERHFQLVDRFDAMKETITGENTWQWKLALEFGCFKSLLGVIVRNSEDIHLISQLFMEIVDRWEELEIAEVQVEVEQQFRQILQRHPYLFYSAIVSKNERSQARWEFFVRFSDDIDRPLYPEAGIAPIGYAARCGLSDLFELLQQNGADIFKIEPNGKTPLEHFLESDPADSASKERKRAHPQEQLSVKRLHRASVNSFVPVKRIFSV